MYRLFIEKTDRKTQSLKITSRALEQQQEKNDRGNLLLGPSIPLEYILGLQIIESTNKKTKETFQQPVMAGSGIMKQDLLLIT